MDKPINKTSGKKMRDDMKVSKIGHDKRKSGITKKEFEGILTKVFTPSCFWQTTGRRPRREANIGFSSFRWL